MIIVIVGPTGVGKTKLSIELAKEFNAEIINADSMQVYRGLDIATAKIKEEEKEGIVHHLFDIKDKKEMYSIYDYQKDCRSTIDNILKRGKNVIIVGGSGLYIKAALYDYKFKDEKINNNYDDLTNKEIKNKIEEYMPCSVHINNRKRLIRMLQKIENDSLIDNNTNKTVYDFITIGLTTTRDVLYKKIDDRVDKMVNDGLIEEAKELYDNNINSKAINTAIGYKELYAYFDNNKTKEEAISNIKRNSRRYAKRQYTFFNNQMNVNWFNTDYDNFNNTKDEVINFIKLYNKANK